MEQYLYTALQTGGTNDNTNISQDNEELSDDRKMVKIIKQQGIEIKELKTENEKLIGINDSLNKEKDDLLQQIKKLKLMSN